MAEEKQPKVNNFGPRGRGPAGPRPKIDNPGKILKRLMGIVLKKYWGLCLVVLASIFASAIANVEAQLFLQKQNPYFCCHYRRESAFLFG